MSNDVYARERGHQNILMCEITFPDWQDSTETPYRVSITLFAERPLGQYLVPLHYPRLTETFGYTIIHDARTSVDQGLVVTRPVSRHRARHPFIRIYVGMGSKRLVEVYQHHERHLIGCPMPSLLYELDLPFLRE